MFLFKIKLKLAREDLPLGDPSTCVPLKLTKRLILSKIAIIFDPLGAWVAVFVKPKIEMQEHGNLALAGMTKSHQNRNESG